MAQLCVCDICREIIAHGNKKYAFAWKKMTEKGQAELSEEYKEFTKNIHDEDYRATEICSECFKVFVYFINIRKNQIDELKKEIELLYKKVSSKDKDKGKTDEKQTL